MRSQRKKAHPKLRETFDKAMILFDEVVEVFHRLCCKEKADLLQ
ncbi:MAG: hypothetical protein NVS4B7_19020 [Ktedonobacteraceae bacterium]